MRCTPSALAAFINPGKRTLRSESTRPAFFLPVACASRSMALVNYGILKSSTVFYGNLNSRLNQWKALREQAGLTLAELAEKSGYSTGTINGLELKGEGSQRLKDKLTEILTPLANKESVTDGRSESAKPPVELRDHPGESDLAIWKRRAQAAEGQLANLRDGLRSLLELSAGTPVSSAASEKARQVAAEVLRRSKSEDQPGDAGSNSKAA